MNIPDIKQVVESCTGTNPKVSVVLLDWSCRDSFHSLHYLNNQTVPREQYEIIWIEYYSNRSPEIEKGISECKQSGKPSIVDKWIVMEMPENVYYHKHLMYNLGIISSKGEVVTFCDSDAIFSPTFVESIIRSFKKDSNIVLHMDEVRNTDKRFHPFNYPSIEDITGKGCTNWKDGMTTGLLDKEDILHTRNYGACMSALREDIINIGGADEHIDYLGHICGPYEMTFRLVNAGKRETWHQKEFLYHTWHRGTDGKKNHLGPHDGRNMSTTALEIRHNSQVLPLVENKVIRSLRTNQNVTYELEKTIDPAYYHDWTHEVMDKSTKFQKLYHFELTGSYKGYNFLDGHKFYYAIPQSLGPMNLTDEKQRNHPMILSTETQEELKRKVDQFPHQVLENYLLERYKNMSFIRKAAEKPVFCLHRRYKTIQISTKNINHQNSISSIDRQSISKMFLIKLVLLIKSNKHTRRLTLDVKMVLKKAFNKYFQYPH